MNNVSLTGRLTREPELRYGGQDNSTAITRFTLAVDDGKDTLLSFEEVLSKILLVEDEDNNPYLEEMAKYNLQEAFWQQCLSLIHISQ